MRLLLLVAVFGCKEIVRFERPVITDGEGAGLLFLEGSDSLQIHALSAEQIREGGPPLDSVPPSTDTMTIFTYSCSLDDLGLVAGLQEPSPDTELLGLPEPIGAQTHSLDVERAASGWETTSSEVVERLRDLHLDLPFLRCPEFEISGTIVLEGTTSVSGFTALPLGGVEWLVTTGAGRHFIVPPDTDAATLRPALVGPRVLGGRSIGDSTYLYTAERTLLRGPIDGCLPDNFDCFELIASNGPSGERAWLDVDVRGDVIFGVVNDRVRGTSIFWRTEGAGFEELYESDLGNTAFAQFLGAVARDGEEFLTFDTKNSSAIAWRDGRIEALPLPLQGVGLTTIAHLPSFGTLLGTDFGDVRARDQAWAALERDGGFLVAAITPLDDGLLVLGQSSFDQFHPGLGGCGLSDGALPQTWAISEMGGNYLLLGQATGPWPVTVTVLRRTNPRPACL